MSDKIWLPYGWMLHCGVVMEHPNEQAVIKEIKGFHATGWTYNQILSWIRNRPHLPPPRGGIWNRYVIINIAGLLNTREMAMCYLKHPRPVRSEWQ